MSIMNYDRTGQLTNEISFTNGIAGFTTNSWAYDEAGNWRNASSSAKWLYNADNELVARAPSGTADVPQGVTTTITGEVEPGPASNKWYNTWAECKGIQARVGTNTGTFSVPNVPVDQWGENILTVTVADVSGNSSTQQRRVIKQVTDASETFKYDGNGNLTNWVCGTTNWVYEWDWADRMTRVTSNGVVVLENWYDVRGRRVGKGAFGQGALQKTMTIWDGWDPILITTETGDLIESYSRAETVAGIVGSVFAATSHGTTPSAGVQYLIHNHRWDVTIVRSNAFSVMEIQYAPFGQVKNKSGVANVRFGFALKEVETSCGLYYFGKRFYASAWQRWLSRDPALESFPEARSLYLFVRNQPTGRIDPIGGTDVPAWVPWVGGGRVCNDTTNSICVLNNGKYETLEPGKCSSWWSDIDGYWVNGRFYVLHNGNGTQRASHPSSPPWDGKSEANCPASRLAPNNEDPCKGKTEPPGKSPAK